MTSTQAQHVPEMSEQIRPQRSAGNVWAARGLAALALAVGATATDGTAAHADNCSGLSDCFFTLAAALLITALLAC
ncbi:MAG: hypothetical protein WAS07_05200 [Micropruina sp.]